VLGVKEALGVVRSTPASAIEMALGLLHPGWSVEVTTPKVLSFRNSVQSHAKDIAGRLLLYGALAKLRDKLANPELFGLVLNNILDMSSGPSASTWSSYRTALEVAILGEVFASQPPASGEVLVRLIGFGFRPKVFLSDMACLATEAPQKESATNRSLKFKELVDRVIPLAIEPNIANEPHVLEINENGHNVNQAASSLRLRCLARVLAKEVITSDDLGSTRSILYRCWYEVTKSCRKGDDLTVLQRVKEIAGQLPGDFDGWRLPQRYLELESDPNRLAAVLSFVSRFATPKNSAQAQEHGTAALESFIASPLGFAIEDAAEGIKAIFEFSNPQHYLRWADWRIPEIRAQICTLGAVLRSLKWPLSSERSSDSAKFAFAQHVSKVLYGHSLDGVNKVGELIAQFPGVLELAEVLWSEPDDFKEHDAAIILERFKHRVIFGKLAANFFPSTAPDRPHELGEMRRLYSKLGRDFNGLFVGIKSIADVGASKVDEFCQRATAALNFHILGGIVQNRIPANDKAIAYYLSDYLLIDGPPYRANDLSNPNSDYVKCIQEVVAVQFEALERYFGQGALKYAFQRAVPTAPMQFGNFLGACARSVALIEGRGDLFPGSGAIFGKVRLSAVFDRDSLGNLGAIYPWAESVISDIGSTTYAYMRGLRLVLPPENKRYKIGGRYYGLLSFQDHFGDRDFKGSCLVEVSAARRLISHIKQLDSFPNSTELLKAIKRETNDILSLTELANLGGFSHSFEPNSAPFLHQMPNPAEVSVVTDYLNHVHASMFSGKYIDRVTESTELAWQPLRQAHGEVRDVANKLFALEGMVRVIFARYSLGFDYSTSHGEDIYPHPDLLIPGEEVVPMFAERTLEFGMRYARELRSAGVIDMNKYPVLVIANPLDHWSRPDESTCLDLYDLCAVGAFGEYRFSGGEVLTDTDISVWRKHFWGPANANGFEIRLEDRRRVFL
jgi:hypothetical protein